jgi:hypothetical protein
MEFSSKQALQRHQTKKFPCTEQIYSAFEDTIKCKFCGNKYEHSPSLYRHVKNCPKRNDEKINITNISNQNPTNIENNTNVQVDGDFKVDGDMKVVKFGDENLSYISDDTFKKIIGRGFKSLEEFMNHVHFNKDDPENHNIYVPSVKDGHVVTFDGKKWNVGISDQLLDDIIQQTSDLLEEKYDEIVDKLSPMESKKFNNFMNRKDDEKVNLKLKRELRVQLYNNRHFAKGARKLIEACEKNKKALSMDDANRKDVDALISRLKKGDIDKDTISSILELANK